MQCQIKQCIGDLHFEENLNEKIYGVIECGYDGIIDTVMIMFHTVKYIESIVNEIKNEPLKKFLWK